MLLKHDAAKLVAAGPPRKIKCHGKRIAAERVCKRGCDHLVGRRFHFEGHLWIGYAFSEQCDKRLRTFNNRFNDDAQCEACLHSFLATFDSLLDVKLLTAARMLGAERMIKDIIMRIQARLAAQAGTDLKHISLLDAPVTAVDFFGNRIGRQHLK